MEHVCTYSDRERFEKIKKALGPHPDIPETCAGGLTWRNGIIWYCEAHGAWQAAFNPFSGIGRVPS